MPTKPNVLISLQPPLAWGRAPENSPDAQSTVSLCKFPEMPVARVEFLHHPQQSERVRVLASAIERAAPKIEVRQTAISLIGGDFNEVHASLHDDDGLEKAIVKWVGGYPFMGTERYLVEHHLGLSPAFEIWSSLIESTVIQAEVISCVPAFTPIGRPASWRLMKPSTFLKKFYASKGIQRTRTADEALFWAILARVGLRLGCVGFERLTDPERIVSLVISAEGEIDNGGLAQFYGNLSGNRAIDTVWALGEIGAPRKAALLKRANGFFPNGLPPEDHAARNARLTALPESDANELSSLDDFYYALRPVEDLNSLILVCFQAHRSDFPEP